MQYEEIESYIRADRPDIWRRLYPLNGFYKDQITRITAENCVFLACYEEAEQVAREVIAWVETQPDELLSGFDLLSQSYAELKELRRITGRVLTRKANRLRRNLRRVIGLLPEHDEVQQAFDNARTASAKSFIIIPDAEHPERSLSAHDLRQFHLSRNYAVNLAIADGIHDLAVNFLNHDGLFLTLTLPGKYRNCSYEQAKAEIGRRWKRVRRKARDRDILLLGMTALELHEDETPHYHIQLYVSPEHGAWVEEQILDAFPNELDRRDEAIKDIREVARASRYTTKDHGKPETSLTFIGLRKDIKRRYRGVFEGKDTSTLSEWRVSRARQLMKQKTLGGAVLLLLRGFADERLNRLSARHPDFHYAGTDTQKLQTMFLHTLHFRVAKDFRKTNTPRVSMISKAPKQANTASPFGPVPTCLYKNQEGVRACSLPCECMGSLGQPPPGRDTLMAHCTRYFTNDDMRLIYSLEGQQVIQTKTDRVFEVEIRLETGAIITASPDEEIAPFIDDTDGLFVKFVDFRETSRRIQQTKDDDLLDLSIAGPIRNVWALRTAFAFYNIYTSPNNEYLRIDTEQLPLYTQEWVSNFHPDLVPDCADYAIIDNGIVLDVAGKAVCLAIFDNGFRIEQTLNNVSDMFEEPFRSQYAVRKLF
ncbi:rolling circle replication-associated protein [Asaia bogorensis]|uniref:rolling circle replication-associated protein n=1 Tax=Asaia bogorensis TaxID=91915 RepID=UPI00285DD0A6|nr:hypothetical protein [Asaia bogorensis]MDR6182944.1 hypothetical protein [Asaia bogorensis NBRC 16594]